MRIQFCGAVGATTGSMFLLEVNHRRPLLERGMFQGRRGELIERIDSFFGHVDKDELSRYGQNLTGDIKKIFVCHGEEEQSLAFGETLPELKPKAEVVVPELLQKEEV